MDGSTLIFGGDRLDRHRATVLDRENEIRRSISDRGVTVRPESPVAHWPAATGLWFRHLFARPTRPRLT